MARDPQPRPPPPLDERKGIFERLMLLQGRKLSKPEEVLTHSVAFWVPGTVVGTADSVSISDRAPEFTGLREKQEMYQEYPPSIDFLKVVTSLCNKSVGRQPTAVADTQGYYQSPCVFPSLPHSLQHGGFSTSFTMYVKIAYV
jgi:hypothetical protein